MGLGCTVLPLWSNTKSSWAYRYFSGPHAMKTSSSPKKSCKHVTLRAKYTNQNKQMQYFWILNLQLVSSSQQVCVFLFTVIPQCSFYYRNTPVLKYLGSPSSTGNLRVKKKKLWLPLTSTNPFSCNTYIFAYNYTCMLMPLTRPAINTAQVSKLLVFLH